VGTAIGLLRLLTGLVAIAALCRRSTVLSDGRACHLLMELLPHLPLHQLPKVRESSDLNSAAVVGWWRPSVMLPADWEEWSSVELKAVLAHELAHIARFDALWRLVAAFTVALNWGQPLMHWLRGQLLLAQELAADEMAAAAMGSKREYLRALARLALRQDSRTTGTPPTALVPVFSGFLLRRMVMLRAKDGSMHRNWRLLAQGIALGMVAAAALLSTAIRGLAEPPQKESDSSIRVAKATDAKLRPPTLGANDAGQAEFFKRPPFDIAKVAQKHGGLLIRLGEILQQPRFAKIAREDDPWWTKAWQGCFPGAAAPPFSLKDIEYIAGDFKLSTRYVTPPPEEKDPHPHQIMFGANTVCVRFHKPVDEIYAWLKRTPGAEENRHGDLPYVELMVPAIGPGKSCFCRVNDHTLLWVGGEGISLVKRLDQLTADSDPPAWNNTWKELERGLITAVAAEVEYKGPPEPIEDEWEKLNQQLFTTARLQAVGADWEPHEGGVVSFKLQFRFDTEGNARTIEAAVRHGLQRMVQDARVAMANAENENEKEKASAIAMIALLEQAQIETRQTENGWQINVLLKGPIDIEANL
jgi:hypothetical protein